jgi:hypothetical protein
MRVIGYFSIGTLSISSRTARRARVGGGRRRGYSCRKIELTNVKLPFRVCVEELMYKCGVKN